VSQEEYWRETLLSVILIVSGLTLAIFTVFYVLNGRLIIAAVEGFGALGLGVGLYLVKKKKSYFWPAIIAWTGVQLVLTMVLFSGGLGGAGLIWWSLLPVNSFILFGKKQGAIWVMLGILITMIVAFLNVAGVSELYFEYGQLMQMLVMVVVVAFIMYYYEKTSGEARANLSEKTSALQELVSSKEETEQKLSENLSVLEKEKQRQSMVQSAMLNLLEDSRELEKQLASEKQGVEMKVEERTSELAQAKAKMLSSIHNLPLGFLMVDVGKRMTVINAIAKDLLGHKTDQDNLKELKNILADKIDLDKYLEKCGIEKKRFVASDVEYKGKILQIMLSPILTEGAESVCIGIVALIQDITEAKVLERSKDEFFSIASHELRTPLTAIRGNTSMILEYYAEAIKEPELKSMIDDVHESSIRLINIVNDFLNLSRLEQGRMSFDIKVFDINELIPETIKEYDVTSSRKNLSIDYIPAKNKLNVVGDTDKVRQVLVNLVGNAIKFTSKGRIKIDVEVMPKYTKVLVTDTGRGISPAQQNLLFRKFQQAGESLFTRDTAGGTGLGLYISRMMIEGMGGKLELEKSEEGKGSVFSFTLPTELSSP